MLVRARCLLSSGLLRRSPAQATTGQAERRRRRVSAAPTQCAHRSLAHFFCPPPWPSPSTLRLSARRLLFCIGLGDHVLVPTLPAHRLYTLSIGAGKVGRGVQVAAMSFFLHGTDGEAPKNNGLVSPLLHDSDPRTQSSVDAVEHSARSTNLLAWLLSPQGAGPGSKMETELAAACTLLAAEFPDTPRSVLESALREVDLDIPAARRKLLELQAERRGQGDSFRATSVSGLSIPPPLPPPPLVSCCPLSHQPCPPPGRHGTEGMVRAHSRCHLPAVVTAGRDAVIA